LIAQVGLGEGERGTVSQLSTKLNIDVAKPLIFNGEARQVSGFLMVCRLYVRIRMRKAAVKK